MARKEPLVKPGDKFGQWEVLSFCDPTLTDSGQKRYRWNCRCSCGIEKEVTQSNLTQGRSKRCCACVGRERSGKNHPQYSHGYSHTQVNEAWHNMKARCQKPKHPSYPDYGGRGIKVCDRWQDFLLFLSDMGEPPTREHTLERMDNDGDYEPGNCKWAKQFDQSRNKRSTRLLTYDGKTMCVVDWAKALKVNHAMITWRLNAGWSVEDALTKPPKKRRRGS